MNNIGITNSPVTFNGLKVKGTVSGENANKLGDFASKVENINFIKDLEKDFNVDVVLNSDVTKMGFSHKTYGDLSEKYGCKLYPLENVFRDVTEVIKDIKTAISKAVADFEKQRAEINATRRGC